MTTTHAEIKQRYHESQKKIQERTADLHNAGQLLLKSYVESLSLPGDTFKDSKGFPRKFVTVGIRSNGVFQPVNISSLHLDNLSLAFYVSTIVDETSRSELEYAEVPISIKREAAAYTYLIGHNKKSFKVVTLNGCDTFSLINNEIKNCVIASFSDPRLD